MIPGATSRIIICRIKAIALTGMTQHTSRGQSQCTTSFHIETGSASHRASNICISINTQRKRYRKNLADVYSYVIAISDCYPSKNCITSNNEITKAFGSSGSDGFTCPAHGQRPQRARCPRRLVFIIEVTTNSETSVTTINGSYTIKYSIIRYIDRIATISEI